MLCFVYCILFFFFKQKTAYEMRISDWSSDVCSSDLVVAVADRGEHGRGKMLRMEVRQCTLAGLADPARRADGVDDIGFGHGLVPCGQAGIRLKGTPLSGRWSCGRPRIFSAIVFSSISSAPPAMRPVVALIPLAPQSCLTGSWASKCSTVPPRKSIAHSDSFWGAPPEPRFL